MTRLLEIALDHEAASASRALDESVNRLNVAMGARGMFNSGNRIVGTVDVYKDSAAKLISAVFRCAVAVHEKAGVPIEEAREAAIDRASRYISELRQKLDAVCGSARGGVGGSAQTAANARFATIDEDFARLSDLYRAGIGEGAAIAAPTHNSIIINGDGNSLVAQQGSSHSTQNVQLTNAVLDRLAEAIDGQALTGPARREIDGNLQKLRAEAAKPQPEKGRLASLLGNVAAVLGIAKEAPAVVQAITDAGRALGIS